MNDDKTNSDRKVRHYTQPILADLISDPGYYEKDTALAGYFDAPRPANDNRRTYRSVRSGRPYHCICSTRFKYVDVSLARVSILDGAQVAA